MKQLTDFTYCYRVSIVSFEQVSAGFKTCKGQVVLCRPKSRWLEQLNHIYVFTTDFSCLPTLAIAYLATNPVLKPEVTFTKSFCNDRVVTF